MNFPRSGSRQQSSFSETPFIDLISHERRPSIEVKGVEIIPSWADHPVVNDRYASNQLSFLQNATTRSLARVMHFLSRLWNSGIVKAFREKHSILELICKHPGDKYDRKRRLFVFLWSVFLSFVLTQFWFVYLDERCLTMDTCKRYCDEDWSNTNTNITTTTTMTITTTNHSVLTMESSGRRGGCPVRPFVNTTIMFGYHNTDRCASVCNNTPWGARPKRDIDCQDCDYSDCFCIYGWYVYPRTDSDRYRNCYSTTTYKYNSRSCKKLYTDYNGFAALQGGSGYAGGGSKWKAQKEMAIMSGAGAAGIRRGRGRHRIDDNDGKTGVIEFGGRLQNIFGPRIDQCSEISYPVCVRLCPENVEEEVSWDYVGPLSSCHLDKVCLRREDWTPICARTPLTIENTDLVCRAAEYQSDCHFRTNPLVITLRKPVSTMFTMIIMRLILKPLVIWAARSTRHTTKFKLSVAVPVIILLSALITVPGPMLIAYHIMTTWSFFPISFRSFFVAFIQGWALVWCVFEVVKIIVVYYVVDPLWRKYMKPFLVKKLKECRTRRRRHRSGRGKGKTSLQHHHQLQRLQHYHHHHIAAIEERQQHVVPPCVLNTS